MTPRLRLAELRDRACRARRRLLHPWDFHRAWFRELARALWAVRPISAHGPDGIYRKPV